MGHVHYHDIHVQYHPICDIPGISHGISSGCQTWDTPEIHDFRVVDQIWSWSSRDPDLDLMIQTSIS